MNRHFKMANPKILIAYEEFERLKSISSKYEDLLEKYNEALKKHQEGIILFSKNALNTFIVKGVVGGVLAKLGQPVFSIRISHLLSRYAAMSCI